MADSGFSPGTLTALFEGAAAVASQPELDAVLATTVTTGMSLTGAPYGALGVLGAHGLLVDFVYEGVDVATADRIGRLPEGRGVLGTITRDGKPLRLSEVSEHPDSVGFPDHHPQMRTLLGVPIQIGTEVFGNLYLAEKEGGFTESDEALVEALAVIAASAVANARIHQRLRRLAVVEERERIARDLHDAIIQELYAVGLTMQTIGNTVPNEEARTRIESVVERLDASITSLRRFIFDLRPPVWGERHLRRELHGLAQQLGASYEAEVELELHGEFDGLDDQLLDTVSNVTREALSNALRHSGSDRVTIIAEEADGRIVITVRDEGVGFDPNNVTRGMGLDNMEQRAAKGGGEVSVSSSLGEGTSVRLVMPHS